MEATTKRQPVEDYLGHEFRSSTCTTLEFTMFAKQFRSAIKKNVAPEFSLVKWNRGHFEVSSFLQNMANGKMVYFRISDVRYFPDEWYSHILIRTAISDRDYIGGQNCYTTLAAIKIAALELTK